LADDPSPAGPKGGPNGHLSLPTSGTGQKETGDIPAGDEEKQPGRQEDQEDHGAGLAVEEEMERNQPGSVVFVGVGVRLFKLNGNSVQVLLGSP